MTARMCLDQLKLKVGSNFEYAVVCSEDHAPKNGVIQETNKHLHAFIKLKKNVRVSETSYFNLWDGEANKHYQCNIKKHRGLPVNSIKYVQKDGNYIMDGKLPSCLTKAGDCKLKKQELYKQVMSEPMHKLGEKGEIHMLHLATMEKSKKIAQQSLLTEEWRARPILPKELELTKMQPEPITLQFNDIGGNDDEGRPVGRQVHHWIKGPPGCGKTYSKTELCQQYRALAHPYSTFFPEEFSDGMQVIICDELVNQIKYYDLN